MHPSNVMLIFIIIAVVYIVYPATNNIIAQLNQSGGYKSNPTKTGGLSLNFSEITDDISTGNLISGSKRINKPGKRYAMRPEFAMPRNNFTFQGHGIPLVNETNIGVFNGQRIPTISGANYKCSPACCPSPYSCDHGCVCVHRSRRQPWGEVGANIR